MYTNSQNIIFLSVLYSQCLVLYHELQRFFIVKQIVTQTIFKYISYTDIQVIITASLLVPFVFCSLANGYTLIIYTLFTLPQICTGDSAFTRDSISRFYLFFREICRKHFLQLYRTKKWHKIHYVDTSDMYIFILLYK